MKRLIRGFGMLRYLKARIAIRNGHSNNDRNDSKIVVRMTRNEPTNRWMIWLTPADSILPNRISNLSASVWRAI